MRKRKLKWRLYLVAALLIVFLAGYLVSFKNLGRYFYPFEYQKEIYYYSGFHNLDPHLVAAVIYVESRFNSTAVSPKGARGLMQIMPETGAWVAQNIGMEGYDDALLFTPQVNIRLGTWYLADLFRCFRGNRAVVLASYNSGRGRVGKWLEEGIWDGEFHSIEKIPVTETRNYIQRVERAYKRYRHFYS